MASLVPYINFAGKSRQAAQFYERIFNGETSIQEYEGKVVQFEFKPGGIHLMGSDHESANIKISGSKGYGLVLNCDTEEQLDSYYAALVEGGIEIFAPTDSGWGAIIAHCMDQFGVSWMLNYDKIVN
jgi:PhnB protein